VPKDGREVRKENSALFCELCDFFASSAVLFCFF
jgi:hypothetical protein